MAFVLFFKIDNVKLCLGLTGVGRSMCACVNVGTGSQQGLSSILSNLFFETSLTKTMTSIFN